MLEFQDTKIKGMFVKRELVLLALFISMCLIQTVCTFSEMLFDPDWYEIVSLVLEIMIFSAFIYTYHSLTTLLKMHHEE